MSLELKDFSLATPIAKAKYMRIRVELLPHDIREKYNIKDKGRNGYVYVKIKKGMYGLKEAVVLACEQLSKFLKE